MDHDLLERRRAERLRMERDMERCLAGAIDFNENPRPWAWTIAYHDGLFYQFLDANDRPVLGDTLRDPEDAALLLRLINHLSS